jgi:hypothetical protein
MRGESVHPSVRHLPISEKRKDAIISILISEFYKTAVGRKVVNTKHVDSTDGLLRLGLNLIVDKIWLVDYVGDTYYDYETLGSMEGKSIALSETAMIVKRILGETASAQNTLKLDTEITEDSIERAISMLEGRGLPCNAILTNVHEVFSFWWFKKFKGVSSRAESPFGFEGTYNKPQVYWTNSIPDNTTLLLNENIGELLIGKDLSADIREIEENEVESILTRFKNLSRNDVKEKVRLIANETIRFDLKRKDANVIIESKKIQNDNATDKKNL